MWNFHLLCLGYLQHTRALGPISCPLFAYMHGDILASHVLELLKQRYPWRELYNALPVGKQMWQMWYTFVKKAVPWPVAVLRAGDFVNKHLAGSKLPCSYCDLFRHSLQFCFRRIFKLFWLKSRQRCRKHIIVLFCSLHDCNTKTWQYHVKRGRMIWCLQCQNWELTKEIHSWYPKHDGRWNSTCELHAFGS